jgi:hypothetical protein
MDRLCVFLPVHAAVALAGVTPVVPVLGAMLLRSLRFRQRRRDEHQYDNNRKQLHYELPLIASLVSRGPP